MLFKIGLGTDMNRKLFAYFYWNYTKIISYTFSQPNSTFINVLNKNDVTSVMS